MARRVVSLSALNIKTHPHEPSKYVELLSNTFRESRAVKIRGYDYGMIGSMYNLERSNPLEGIHGTIFRFLNIDPHETWLDLTNKQPIEQTEEGEDNEVTLNVPDHLKPNLRQIPYIFYPQKHRLFFDNKDLQPSSAQKLFTRLFSSKELFKAFGHVDVYVESSKEVIESILAIPHKQKISVHITRPNNDDMSEQAKRILDKIDHQNAKALNQELVAANADGLKPDEETIILIEAARSNGSVKAEGYDENHKKIERSTVDHPLIEKAYYDEQTQTSLSAMHQLSARVLASIAKI